MTWILTKTLDILPYIHDFYRKINRNPTKSLKDFISDIINNNVNKSDVKEEAKLEFFEPSNTVSTGYMKISQEAGKVHVTWGMKGKLSYPIERVFGLFLPSMVAPDFETGLKSLKAQLEK